jgi:hypothetical protein
MTALEVALFVTVASIVLIKFGLHSTGVKCVKPWQQNELWLP